MQDEGEVGDDDSQGPQGRERDKEERIGRRKGVRKVREHVGERFDNRVRVKKKQEGNRELSLEPRSLEGEATPG